MVAAAKNVHQRIAAAMASVSYVQKDKPAGLKYAIVSHDAVTALVRPALLEQGVIYYPIKTTPSQNGNRTDVHMIVRFANIDDPADHIDVESFGHGIDQGDKAPGKAMSYCVKYAVLKTLGLESGEDSDYDQNVKHAPALPRASEPVDESVTTYVNQMLEITADRWVNAEAIKAWWNKEKGNREALGIVSGNAAHKKLFDAFVSRGRELAAASTVGKASISTKYDGPTDIAIGD